ncbi:MAG: dUTP diphosphatase [Clostridia bacterium]|nr:dUTP diphosphatase [Clostridia bacterium]
MRRETVKLPVKKAVHARDIPLPRYMTDGSSGMDLYAAVEGVITAMPGEVILIPTGLLVAVPNGYELQIRPRSGLAAKQGIGILNSPGTIDSDYRGEIKVILINLGKDPFEIKRTDRIAQMILCPVPRAVLEEMDELPPTGRNDGGFGHTG